MRLSKQGTRPNSNRPQACREARQDEFGGAHSGQDDHESDGGKSTACPEEAHGIASCGLATLALEGVGAGLAAGGAGAGSPKRDLAVMRAHLLERRLVRAIER